MKRAPELRALSEDHHHGLVLARKARLAGAGEGTATPGEVWTQVLEAFETELEPHFRIEESLLAPALEAAGETPLVGRLLEEHAALRELVGPESPRTPATLGRFGEVLEKHIRFEERELFEAAQRILSAEQLRAVAAASEADATAPPGPDGPSRSSRRTPGSIGRRRTGRSGRS